MQMSANGMNTELRSPRERLIAAAEGQFRRFGYRRTTIEDITNEAGTGKGSLYLHFPSKQDAYLAVVATSFERFLQKAATTLRGPGTVPERLAALVRLTAEHYGNDELLRASLFGDRSLVEGQVSKLAADVQRTRMRQLLAETLEEGKREGSVRPGIDPRVAAAVVFEMGWAIVRAELDGDGDLPLDVALAEFNLIVGRGLVEPPNRD